MKKTKKKTCDSIWHKGSTLAAKISSQLTTQLHKITRDTVIYKVS